MGWLRLWDKASRRVVKNYNYFCLGLSHVSPASVAKMHFGWMLVWLSFKEAVDEIPEALADLVVDRLFGVLDQRVGHFLGSGFQVLLHFFAHLPQDSLAVGSLSCRRIFFFLHDFLQDLMDGKIISGAEEISTPPLHSGF